jgi:YidC/Oxa1 family membrane protein insertase
MTRFQAPAASITMDNSRLFLFAALVFVGMLMWQQWQIDYGPQPVSSSESIPAVDGNITEQGVPGDDLPEQADELSPGTVTDSSTGTGEVSPTLPQQQLVRIDTDVVRAMIDTRGGVIRSLKLKKYPTSLEQPDDWLELIHSDSDSVYIVQSGLRNKEEKAPTHYSTYRTDQTAYELADGQDELVVPMYWTQDGIKVVKSYHFRRGDYLIDVRHQIENGSAQEWQVDFDDMEDAQLKLESTGGWIAMIHHYFLSAWVPGQDETNLIYTIANTKRNPSTYTVGLRSANRVVAVGGSSEFASQLFVGPKIVRRLEEISPGLDLTVDYGVLTFLSKPLYWLLSWYHGFVGNWGVAIILLTLTVKAVFYKLSETSYRSMAKMRKVSPRLKTLKERYGDDRQKMNQAMMELYKTEKINPMGGCLPILVQIPVFIALYWALLESVDLRQAPFIFWIKDLSVMDPFYVLPVVMGISMVTGLSITYCRLHNSGSLPNGSKQGPASKLGPSPASAPLMPCRRMKPLPQLQRLLELAVSVSCAYPEPGRSRSARPSAKAK